MEGGFKEVPDERITKGNEKLLRVINNVHVLTFIMASCVYTYVKFYQIRDIHCGLVIPQQKCFLKKHMIQNIRLLK